MFLAFSLQVSSFQWRKQHWICCVRWLHSAKRQLQRRWSTSFQPSPWISNSQTQAAVKQLYPMPTRPLSCAQNIGADKSRHADSTVSSSFWKSNEECQTSWLGLYLVLLLITRSDTGSTRAKYLRQLLKLPADNETITSDLQRELSDMTVYWGMMPNNSPVNLSTSN